MTPVESFFFVFAFCFAFVLGVALFLYVLDVVCLAVVFFAAGLFVVGFFSPNAFFAAGFFAFFGLLALCLATCVAFVGFLAAFTSPILKSPDYPDFFDYFNVLFFTPALSAMFR